MKFCFQTKQFTEIDTDKFKPALIDATRTLSWFEFYEEVDLVIDFFKKNDLLKRKLYNKQIKLFFYFKKCKL